MAGIPLRGLQSVSVKQSFFDQETRTNIIDYSMEVENHAAPDEVLNRLHEIISENSPIRVLGANRYPTKVGDWRRIQLGKNAFVHRDVPRAWTEEWTAFVKCGHCLGLMTARMCLAPFTSTEMTRMFDPNLTNEANERVRTRCTACAGRCPDADGSRISPTKGPEMQAELD